MTWPTKRIGAHYIGSLARPTPDFKLPPLGPRPNPSPPGVVAWAFSANPRPTQAPYPTVLGRYSLSFCLLSDMGQKNEECKPYRAGSRAHEPSQAMLELGSFTNRDNFESRFFQTFFEQVTSHEFFEHS
ncbi:hypothetical protein Hanom_Chr02g00158801 [Helianthus anomalus]